MQPYAKSWNFLKSDFQGEIQVFPEEINIINWSKQVKPRLKFSHRLNAKTFMFVLS